MDNRVIPGQKTGTNRTDAIESGESRKIPFIKSKIFAVMVRIAAQKENRWVSLTWKGVDRQNFVHYQRCPVLIEIHDTALFQFLLYTVRFLPDSCNVPLFWYEYSKNYYTS